MREAQRLDLLSTSHKSSPKSGEISENLQLDIDVLIECSIGFQNEKCDRGAPFIFFQDHSGIVRIVQGCCNNWTCSRCGQIRARTEYGRMVAGATILAEKNIAVYMHTWTCLGREMPLHEAEANYGKWTNAMLNNCRNRSKSQGGHWFYAQVTERQTRQHPHSHLIMSFLPDDAKLEYVKKRNKDGVDEWREVYISEWYAKRLKSSRLGKQHEITLVRNHVAVAVYAAKYLFKDAIFTEWPPKWKRVRYSQSWPKNPEHKAPEMAWPLIKHSDWMRVRLLNRPVHVDCEVTLIAAKNRGIHIAG